MRVKLKHNKINLTTKRMIQKEYNMFVLRNHNQVRAKQKLLGYDWNYDQQLKNVQLLDRRICPGPEIPELSDVEKYEIVLDILNPNLIDLYREIQRVCPEFSFKKSFHLYWKNSSSEILPISNYITYLSMMSTIADENRSLYLVAREWSDPWRRDIATTYTAVPEDTVLVNMIAPRQSAYTAAQERWLSIAKSAATVEYTRTYNPPRPKLSELKTQESKLKGKPGKKKK